MSSRGELPAHQPHCLACGVDNPTGLPPTFGREGERVLTEVSFDRDHSGAVDFAHGGAIATVLDDTIGTLPMAVVERVGVTARLEVDYICPVSTGAQDLHDRGAPPRLRPPGPSARPVHRRRRRPLPRRRRQQRPLAEPARL